MSVSMDGIAKRTEGRQAQESYTMLVESNAMMREHRTLRRELCISRMIIFALLIPCIAFCAVRYFQEAAGEKNANILTLKNITEMLPRLYEYDDDDGYPNETHVPFPPTAFLHITATPASEKANLTWQLYPEHLCFNFVLNDNGEALVIPRTGWYRLGLQITYTNEMNRVMGEQIVLAHKVLGYSGMYSWEELIILSVCETVSNKSIWQKSVFSEVVHVFHEGDKVKVRSYNAKYIDSYGERTAKTFLTAQLISVIEAL